MGAQEWVTLLLGLFGMVITTVFRTKIKVGSIWAAVFVLGVSLALATAAVALTGQQVTWSAVFAVAVLAHEGLGKLLWRRPAEAT